MTGIHHHSVIQRDFTALKILCALPFHPLLPAGPPATALFTVTVVSPSPEPQIVAILQNGAFSN